MNQETRPATEDLAARYYLDLVAAFVRGRLGEDAVRQGCRSAVDSNATGERERIFRQGRQAGLKLHRFKRTMDLPRVARVLGILKGVGPGNLLDVGSGRGAFLWPLLDAFPGLAVTAVDLDARRAEELASLRAGGVARLTALTADAADLPFKDRDFDVVTALEVVEHTKDPLAALREVARVARRVVVVSVPSREDDNPGHLHLVGRELITEGFSRGGIERVSFDAVRGHLLAVGRRGGRP